MSIAVVKFQALSVIDQRQGSKYMNAVQHAFMGTVCMMLRLDPLNTCYSELKENYKTNIIFFIWFSDKMQT